MARGDEPGVLHLHGWWDDPESVVLGIRSYEKVLGDAHAQAMQRALRSLRTLLFVGCGAGLGDPNFGALLEWSRGVFAGSQTRHYRLALESEVAELQRQHPDEERIIVLSYGKGHGDLAPYLRDLAPAPKAVPPLPPPDKARKLPAAPNCFGRKEEVKDLVKTLLKDDPPPTPLLGGPGIGKSTVSLNALHDARVAARFGDRRYFVRCDGSKDRDAVVAEIAREMGVEVGPQLEARVFTELARAPAVLVLDNAETPWEADTEGAEALFEVLGAVEGMVLVASIRGGQRPFGPHWREAIRLQPLELIHARKAFLVVAGERYRDEPLLDALLNAVDRVPIAVVLLAHQAEGEPDLAGVWSRWQAERTAMLRRARGADRLTNIEVSFELSIQGPRMDDDARRLLALLGLLPDGIARADLDTLLPKIGARAAGTLRRVGLAFDEGLRLRVLAPVREYVHRQHSPRPDDLDRALVRYNTLAEDEGERVGAAGGAEAIGLLGAESANIDAMVLLGLDRPDPGPSIRAACALANLIRFTGSATTSVLERARDVARSSEDGQSEADCVLRLGVIALARYDHAAARARFEEALPLYRRAGSARGEANCILRLGVIALRRSDHAAARVRFEEALPLYRRAGDVIGEANCIKGLGDIALERYDHGAARARFEEAFPLYRRAGSARGEADCILRLGVIALRRSDHDAARARFEEAFPLYRRAGSARGEANCILRLGVISLRRSDHEAARARFEEALPLYRRVGHVLGEANCIQSLGDIARARSDHEAARARFEEALPLYRRAGDVIGEANCIKGLGDIALERPDHAAARARFEEALALFQRIPEPYSIGWTYRGLARLATSDDERRRHVLAAREAWRSIDREDLVEKYLTEFDDPIQDAKETS